MKRLAIFLFLACWGIIPQATRAAEALCWECLAITRPYDTANPSIPAAGDLVACEPCGFAWGRKQGLPMFEHVMIYATEPEIRALTVPLIQNGQANRMCRYYFDGGHLRDHATGQAVTPAQALSIQETGQ